MRARTVLFILLAMVVIAGFALVPALAQSTDPGPNPPPASEKPDDETPPPPAPPETSPTPPADDSVLTPELKTKFADLKRRIAALETTLANLKTMMTEGLEQAEAHKAENVRAVEEHYSNVGDQIRPLLEEHYARDDISRDEKKARADNALTAFKRELADLE